MTRRQLAPVVLLLCVGVSAIGAALGLLPPPARLFQLLTNAVAQNAAFVAICALIENTVGVNVLFPGAVAVLYGMASTHDDPPRAALFFFLIAAASFVGQNLSFAAGRGAARGALGAWSQVITVRKDVVENGSWLGAFAAFWHPTTGAAYSYHLGFNAVSYSRFAHLYAVAGGAWTTAWGVSMYGLGSVPISGESLLRTFVVGLIIWFGIETARARRKPASVQQSSP